MNTSRRKTQTQTWRTLVGLVLLLLNAAQTQSATVSDFDDGLPDWDVSDYRGATFSETDGHLVATGNIPAKTDCITWNLSTVRWWESLAASEREVLSLRVDMVEAGPNDVQALLQYVTPGTGGYALIKDEDEIWLTKFQWVNCGGNAPFFYEQVPVKNGRVRLVLELKKTGPSLEITSKVLDLENANAVLFEKTVIDTSGVDPTLPSFRGYTWSADAGPPILNGTALEMGVINVAATAQSSVRLAFDNLTYDRQPVLTVEKAVRLSWPASFPGMDVLGAPSVDGPWTKISEPIMESQGNCLMTVPSPLSETLRVFRLEQTPSP